MVNDVETVLKEIRDRVIAENTSIARSSNASLETTTGSHPQASLNHHASLDRLSAQLAVTARAWDRLPPVISNRGGALRRIEISIKKIFRPLTRWFTWEQVNFNAAVHQALLETLALLRAQEQELISLRSALNKETSDRRDLRAQASELRAGLDRVDVTLSRYSEMMRELAEEMRKGQADLTSEMQKRFPEMAADVEARLKKLAQDFAVSLAEISADFREEQRVCFKQLSLEASEAAVLEDRGRRALEARIEKLERAVSEDRPSGRAS